MKLSKQQFKIIIKDCIKELIVEGAFESSIKQALVESANHGGSNSNVSAFDILNSHKSQRQHQEDEVPQYLNEVLGTPSKTVYEQSALAQRSNNSQQQSAQNNRLSMLVKQTAYEQAGGDTKKVKLMESIFADTAMTTSVLQMNDPASRVSGLSQIIPDESPISVQHLIEERKQLENLAPEGDISRWAKVAAMSMRSKKN